MLLLQHTVAETATTWGKLQDICQFILLFMLASWIRNHHEQGISGKIAFWLLPTNLQHSTDQSSWAGKSTSIIMLMAYNIIIAITKHDYDRALRNELLGFMHTSHLPQTTFGDLTKTLSPGSNSAIPVRDPSHPTPSERDEETAGITSTLELCRIRS